MRHIPIKLGPLAILLAVVSICMATLGILAFSTAKADWSLAREHADTVRVRYGLEAEGQKFLQEAARALQEGDGLESLADAQPDGEGVFWRTFTEGAFDLQIGIRQGREGDLQVISWRMHREWEPDGDLNLWSGE